MASEMYTVPCDCYGVIKDLVCQSCGKKYKIVKESSTQGIIIQFIKPIEEKEDLDDGK